MNCTKSIYGALPRPDSAPPRPSRARAPFRCPRPGSAPPPLAAPSVRARLLRRRGPPFAARVPMRGVWRRRGWPRRVFRRRACRVAAVAAARVCVDAGGFAAARVATAAVDAWGVAAPARVSRCGCCGGVDAGGVAAARVSKRGGCAGVAGVAAGVAAVDAGCVAAARVSRGGCVALRHPRLARRAGGGAGRVGLRVAQPRRKGLVRCPSCAPGLRGNGGPKGAATSVARPAKRGGGCQWGWPREWQGPTNLFAPLRREGAEELRANGWGGSG
jgi:hypothetical protein